MLSPRLVSLLLLLGLVAACQALPDQSVNLVAPPAQAAASDTTIRLDANVRFQTIVGWEAVAQAGQSDSSAFAKYKDTLFDLAVNDLGITRLRVEVGNPPGSTSFDLGALDGRIETVVLPMRKLLEARGEDLFVNLCYVGFDTTRLNTQPDVYAREVLRTYQHLEQKYGLVPDSWEISLEPDGVAAGQWNGKQIGALMVATGDLLKSSGYTPRFIAPSTTNMGNALRSLDEMGQVAGALPYLYELSYHRYAGVSDANLQMLAARAQQLSIHTAMLEHIGSGYQDLHQDLSVGNNAAWEQYTLAYPTKDNGAQYYVIDDSNPQSPRVLLGERTKFLRQYFKFIRPGAVRIGAQAAGGLPYFDPIAFINPDGRWVVVIASKYPGLPSSRTFSIAGLPAGTYGIKYTTSAKYDADLPDQTITQGQSVTAEFGSAGVMTIYGKAPATSTSQTPTGTVSAGTVAPTLGTLPPSPPQQTTSPLALDTVPGPTYTTTIPGPHAATLSQPIATSLPASEPASPSFGCLPPLLMMGLALESAGIAYRRLTR